ncbi:MAG TPA: DoxX family protein [Steroidobacteraceae bacterium]|nr:DoxX family protein [Steroidobacteraceae bacterium]
MAAKVWIGWGLCGLVIAFLLLDGVMKVIAPSFVLEAGELIGFPGVAMSRGLGLLLLACALLYIVPRTSVVGAILVTAYLGGAVATHVRLGHPLFSHVLFGVYVGILMWGGLALRSPDLLAILLRD